MLRTASARSVVAATLLAAGPAAAQTPPEPFKERLEVRETSVAVSPPGSGAQVPALEELAVLIGGEPQRVTRVEKVFAESRGDWQFVVYLDPRLAGAQTRYLAALALAQRAEELSALGTVEVVVAEAGRPALQRTDSWQRIEAALYQHALEARHRQRRGDAALERPEWTAFHERLELLLGSLAERGAGGARALLLPSDGMAGAPRTEALEQIARALAGAGWVTIVLPWSEPPSERSADRLSEFEQWRQSAEGRDVSAGTRRYVIDFIQVARRLRGAQPAPRPDPGAALTPRLLALQALAGATSGRLAAADVELQAALADLARRWRVWFQVAAPGDGELRELEVQRGDKPLAAPAWILSPEAE